MTDSEILAKIDELHERNCSTKIAEEFLSGMLYMSILGSMLGQVEEEW